jgi:hypothetical protein
MQQLFEDSKENASREIEGDENLEWHGTHGLDQISLKPGRGHWYAQRNYQIKHLLLVCIGGKHC